MLSIFKSKSEDNVNLYLEDSDEKLLRYDEIMFMIKQLDNEKKAIEQEIKNLMGDMEEGYIGVRKVSFKTVVRNTLDSKKLKEEMPSVYEKYKKESISRSFRIS